MQLADFQGVHVYAIPMTARFRGIDVREGMVLQGPSGWGEFCPFDDYDDVVAATWMATAVESCFGTWPAPHRAEVEVNCIVPAVGPEVAAEYVRRAGCRTVKVKVAHESGIGADAERVSAVRDALGASGAIRVDANGAWDVDEAVANLRLLERAAGGLQYAEQPCATYEQLKELHTRTDVPLAADELIRRAVDPMRARARDVADVAIIKCTPLGGVERALAVAESTELPCVVSSALETSVGLAAGVRLAATLPSLDHACGLDTLALFVSDVVGDGSLRSERGVVAVPERAPSPDPALLHRYRADAPREWWWRERAERALALLEHG
ncbi:o-succinylbenzoate synthase [Tsukamurella sp. 8F]|uniref:o-succinylbenzoate synthase n=1 Tax=unclassified Tsukamurella TaxID=2633480 RepID=UPI0023BA25CF|nr:MULTISPECIES: o-succinylbenzoate synthase [unclassified Tsukamurella]MDF0528905.1 o-succinylbenzoate synthase [Tsukamurella sp. 8J]MDF0586740.1 o-succinylbenzoate synthase [Tsukamurella sp. 8F]